MGTPASFNFSQRIASCSGEATLLRTAPSKVAFTDWVNPSYVVSMFWENKVRHASTGLVLPSHLAINRPSY